MSRMSQAKYWNIFFWIIYSSFIYIIFIRNFGVSLKNFSSSNWAALIFVRKVNTKRGTASEVFLQKLLDFVLYMSNETNKQLIHAIRQGNSTWESSQLITWAQTVYGGIEDQGREECEGGKRGSKMGFKLSWGFVLNPLRPQWGMKAVWNNQNCIDRIGGSGLKKRIWSASPVWCKLLVLRSEKVQ